MSIQHPSLEQLVGRKMTIETIEGSIISGRITSVEYQDVTVLGIVTKTPTKIIFNNDPTDFTAWPVVRSITPAK